MSKISSKLKLVRPGRNREVIYEVELFLSIRLLRAFGDPPSEPGGKNKIRSALLL